MDGHLRALIAEHNLVSRAGPEKVAAAKEQILAAARRARRALTACRDSTVITAVMIALVVTVATGPLGASFSASGRRCPAVVAAGEAKRSRDLSPPRGRTP